MLEGNTSQLREFLEFIYGDQTGYSYLLYIERGSDSVSQRFFKYPQECSSLVAQVARWNNTGDIYYSPGLFSEPSGKREHFCSSQVVWCEFDGNAGDVDLASQGIPLPSLRIQSSRAGYEHWYWRLDSEIRNSKDLEAFTARLAFSLSADHCWNANRVLRLPGTTHIESGQQVKILSQNFTKTSLISFSGLYNLPDAINNFTVGSIPKILDVIAKYKWDKEVWELFKTEKHKVGTRSSALSKLALHCVEMEMTNSEVISVLYNADDRWEKFKHRSDRKERIYSLAKYALGKKLREGEIKKSTKLKVYNFEEFFEENVSFEWVIPEVLAEQGSALIAGEPGIGKTQVTLQTAIHLGLGKQFIGWEKPNRSYKSLILSLEMNHTHLMRFLDSMKKDLSKEDFELLKENLKIVPLGAPLHLDRPEDQEQLNEVLATHRPDGVFIDSLGQAMVGLNDDENVNNTFNYVNGTIRGRFHAFTWFVHFPRKGQVGNRKPKQLDDLYGNRYIGGQIDLGLLLWRNGDSIEISTLKNRLAEPERPKNIRRTEHLNFELSGFSTTKTNDIKMYDEGPLFGGL